MQQSVYRCLGRQYNLPDTNMVDVTWIVDAGAVVVKVPVVQGTVLVD